MCTSAKCDIDGNQHDCTPSSTARIVLGKRKMQDKLELVTTEQTTPTLYVLTLAITTISFDSKDTTGSKLTLKIEDKFGITHHVKEWSNKNAIVSLVKRNSSIKLIQLLVNLIQL